jgi:hypothetical protein
MTHKVYKAIIKAIKAGELTEPFTKQDFQMCCPGLGDGTYNAFLPKHAKGNPGGNSELFERVRPGQFRCLRPFKYGF